MGLKKIKVHCSEIITLMSNVRTNKPLTESQWVEFMGYLDKEEPLTDRQISILKEYVLKQTNYNPKMLTSGTKSMLIEMYSWALYGKRSVNDGSLGSVSAKKGIVQEGESINLLSEIDGIDYKKNTKRYSNSFMVGVPDIITKVGGIKKVIDIKTPLDINSFLLNFDTELQKEYLYQMRGYIELTKADIGEVCFCLVNAPPELIENEVKKIKSLGFLYDWSDDYISQRIAQVQNNMIFDEIPINRKVIRFTVERDDNFINDVHNRVLIAREWISDIHKRHTKRCRTKR